MPKFSVKKPLTVFVAVLAIIVLGVVAYLKMTPDLMPNMDLPYVMILTTDPGASPESVENDITKPMEQAMATLDEIKTVSSTSQDSVSILILEFESGANMDTISVDIQQKISALQGEWDDMVGAPYVLKINPSMLPVMVSGVSYDGKDIQDISSFVTETLEGKLTGVTGVAQVTVSGTVEQQVHVMLSEEKLEAVSARLQEAIEAQIDKNLGALLTAKSQVEAAQKQLKDAQGQAVGSIVNSAVGAAQTGLQVLGAGMDEVQEELETLQGLMEDQIAVDNELADVSARISELQGIASPSPEEQQELQELQQQENTLVGRQAEIDAAMAAYSTSPENVAQRIGELTDALDKAGTAIDIVSSDLVAGYISSQATDKLSSAMDGVSQLISGKIQIESALSQINEGLSAIAAARQQAKDQADMSDSLSISTIAALLTAQDFYMPAGYISDNDGITYMVSVGDNITDRESLEKLVLLDLGIEGMEPLYLGDIADVIITDNAAEIYAKMNQSDSVIATFTKQSNYATAEVSEKLQERFAQLEQEYEGLHFVSLMDQGDYIRLIVNTILSSLLWGAAFSVIVLFLFLRDWRPTIVTLVSIPVSLVFAVVLMYFTGVTINMISLSGLAVSVGMLVDNSVVVIENIYRLRAKGATVVQAAVSGAQQVMGAVVASTLTTVCVFVPIVFVEGLTKSLFTDLALTMTYALLASLMVSLTLVPAMSTGLLRRADNIKPGLLDKVYPLYRKAAAWSLQHKAAVLGGALALLIASGLITVQRGFTYMPDIDMNMITLTVTMPEDATMEEAVALADEVMARALTVENVDNIGASMTAGGSFDIFSMGSGTYDVTMYVTMPEGTSGKKAGEQIEALCSDLACEVTAAGAMDTMSYLTGDGISVTVNGEDMTQLQTAAEMVAAELEKVEGIAEVSDGLQESAEALHITVDRVKAMEHGMTVAQVYMQIASQLSSTLDNGSMELDQQSVSVVIEASEANRITVETLPDMMLTPQSMTGAAAAMSGSSTSGMSQNTVSDVGQSTAGETQGEESFRLGDIATVERTVSMNSIARVDQRRCVTVSGTVDEDHNVTLVDSAAQKALKDVELPEGIEISFGGETEAIMDAVEQLLLMMLLGVLLVYFIMVAQFQSLKSPFIVMFTIPLAFTGGLLALLFANMELSVVSMIGFVMLVGIIVNNGIVLVDYINQLRLSGMERREAIIEAGVTRMRPIMMTSLTTILGLIVMAMARNVGTSLVQPVAVVCIGGLLYATLMTLFVVPCMYDVANRKELRKVEEEELELLTW